MRKPLSVVIATLLFFVSGSSTAVSELLIDQWADVKGSVHKVRKDHPDLDQEAFVQAVQDDLKNTRLAAQMVTASALGVGLEMMNPGSGGVAATTAGHAAQIALDHNFFSTLPAVLRLAWSGYAAHSNVTLVSEYVDILWERGYEALAERVAQDVAIGICVGKLIKVGSSIIVPVGKSLYRLCPQGVQDLSAEGIKQVKKALHKMEVDAFRAQSQKDARRIVQKMREREGKALSKEGKAALPKPEDRPLSSEFYSTAFQVRLKEGVHFPGTTRLQHFQEANKQLYHKIQANPAFGKQMETLYPGITKAVSPGPRGAFPVESPLNLTWHHHPHKKGLLELVPHTHHTAKGPVSGVLHPQRKGGYHNWGGINKK